MNGLFNWFRVSLRRQLNAALSGFMVFVMLTFVVTLTGREEREMLGRHQDSAQALVLALVASSGPFVASRDLVALQEIVGALGGYPDFDAAMHLDIQGRVLSHSDPQHLGRYVADLPEQPLPVINMDGKGHVDLAYPVVLAGGHVGWVRLVVSGQTLQAATLHAREQALMYVLAGLLFAIILSSWLGASVTRRLSAIRAVTDLVKAGRRESRVTVEGLDEVAKLASDLNGMLDTIQNQSFRLQAVIDGTGVGAWEWNVMTNEVAFNEQWARLFGYAAAELQPLDISIWSRLTLAADREASQAAFDAHIRGKTPFFEAEFRAQHKDGRQLWVLARGRAMERAPDGKAVRMFGTVTDITLRKLAENELRVSRDQLHALFANTPIGVARITTDGRYLDANASLQRMLGHTLSELQTMRFQELTAPECRESDARYIAELLINGSNGPYEKSYIRADQSVVHGRINSVVIRQPGQDPFIWNVIEDVTVQKAMETVLREARSQAEQASRAKSQFVANMSHEIRTPLNAVLGMLQLLHRTPLSERQLDYVDKSEGAARSLLGLLNDILDYSKVEAGKLSLDLDQFQISQLLEDLSVILAGNLKGRRIEVVFDIEPDLPAVVVGDALRLKQILINLCGNAIKFTPHGEVILHIQAVSQGSRAQPGEIELAVEVTDSGIGIAPEVQEKIFSGFTQAESSTTRKFGGTGLGLYISQRLVQLMGGQLALTSSPGRGSAFSFRLVLPVVKAGPVHLRAVHVLVVEPHAPSRAALEKAIFSLGWTCVTVGGEAPAEAAWSGSKAVGLAPFDVVLVDRSLCVPKTLSASSGFCKVLLAEPCPPLLMVAGYGEEESLQEVQVLLESGAVWLPKPLTASALRRAFKQVQQRPACPSTGPVETGENGSAPPSVWGGLDTSSDSQRLDGLRLLLVEDNPINQQVARELLTLEGAQVVVAGNGQVAVDLLSMAGQGAPFDLVLMDMQMPVMDGLQATHVIRERLGLRTIPIVAMTANAMPQDKMACLEAGMNDHVGKPFGLDELVSAVLRWTQGPAPEATVSVMLRAGSNRTDLPDWVVQLSPDAQRLAVEPALQRLGGDCVLYERVLAGVLDALGGLKKSLAQQAAKAELGGLSSTLHTLKGSAATAGLQNLSSGAAQLEQLLKSSMAPTASGEQSDASRWQRGVDALLAEWPESVAVAQSALFRLQSQLRAAKQGGDADAPRTLWVSHLQQMLPLLASGDMDVLERYDLLVQWPSFLGEVSLEKFRLSMESMDFETASIELQVWLDAQTEPPATIP